ncbi:hypothetical protein [Methanobrevibacter sp.]
MKLKIISIPSPQRIAKQEIIIMNAATGKNQPKHSHLALIFFIGFANEGL